MPRPRRSKNASRLSQDRDVRDYNPALYFTLCKHRAETFDSRWQEQVPPSPARFRRWHVAPAATITGQSVRHLGLVRRRPIA